MRSVVISSIPFGLQCWEASLAINLEGAIPTEQVMPSSFSTRARIAVAISRPVPNSLRAPVTSRKASSSEIGSTSGVYELNICITRSDISE